MSAFQLAVTQVQVPGLRQCYNLDLECPQRLMCSSLGPQLMALLERVGVRSWGLGGGSRPLGPGAGGCISSPAPSSPSLPLSLLPDSRDISSLFLPHEILPQFGPKIMEQTLEAMS